MSPILPPNQDHEKTPTEKEFDKLHFVIATPNSATLINDPETTVQPVEVAGQTPEKKKSPKKLIAIGSGVLALLAVSIFASTALKEKGDPTDNPGSTISEQSNPAPAETSSLVDALEMLPTVESLEMDASLLSDPEKLAQVWVNERMTSWINSGAIAGIAEAAFASNISAPEYANKIAAEYDKIYIDALLADNWTSNEFLVDIINQTKKLHAQTLLLFILTSGPYKDSTDIEPYSRGEKIIGIENLFSDDESVSMSIILYDYDNSQRNRVGEDLTNNKNALNNGNKTFIVSVPHKFIEVDGKIKLADLDAGQERPDQQYQ